MTIVNRIIQLLEEGKADEVLKLKDVYRINEESQMINAIMYALDEDGHTGSWKIDFARDYYKKLNEGYDFSNKARERFFGDKTV